MRISVIIPVMNEAPRLQQLLPALAGRLESGQAIELLVVDGGSTDGSGETALAHGARLLTADRGRAVQMNAGAREARGDILYFLHADSLPPAGFDRHILGAMARGPVAGCFRLRFHPPHGLLDLCAWFTRYNLPLCRGGDQSLFVPRPWFEALGGFDERFRIYEDNEFIGRLYSNYRFTVLPQEIVTSSRRYEEVGVLRLQYHYSMIHLKRLLGHGPGSLHAYYARHIAGSVSRVSTDGNNPGSPPGQACSGE